MKLKLPGMRTEPVSPLSGQRGATSIIVAIVMAMLIGFSAFAIDVGYFLSTRSQLQNIADSAALAAARKLSEKYGEMTGCADYTGYDIDGAGDRADIVAEADAVAQKNKAAGKNISITSGNVAFYRWDGSNWTATTSRPNAVRVTATLTTNTFFAGILSSDQDTVTSTKQASAALTGVSLAEKGQTGLPVGIPLDYVDNPDCSKEIELVPGNAPNQCAGWHTYKSPSVDPEDVQEILVGLHGEDPDFENPLTEVGQTYQFIDLSPVGLDDPTYNAFIALFEKHKENDTFGNPVWRTTVVVYDGAGCSDPSGARVIKKFAEIIIQEPAADLHAKSIRAKVQYISVRNGTGDDHRDAGSGEWDDYGLLGSVPSLVE